jgi:predicted flap endonuclease-1-like 5' DNA nuclease
MLWLILQMWFWLLLAAVLGWFLRSWLSGDSRPSQDDAAELARSRSRIQTLEAENARFKGDIVRLRDDMNARDNAGGDAEALAKLRADLDACGKERARLTSDLAALKAEFAKGTAADFESEAAALRARVRDLEAQLDVPAPITLSASAPVASPPVTFMSAPVEGEPDDLKKIKGIGPKLEKTLHDMGVYYYRQIASWGASNLVELDTKLETFKGRAGRDNWIDQAKLLAAGGETEFAKRNDEGIK